MNPHREYNRRATQDELADLPHLKKERLVRDYEKVLERTYVVNGVEYHAVVEVRGKNGLDKL